MCLRWRVNQCASFKWDWSFSGRFRLVKRTDFVQFFELLLQLLVFLDADDDSDFLALFVRKELDRLSHSSPDN